MKINVIDENNDAAALWMLHPLELNKLSTGKDEFPNT